MNEVVEKWTKLVKPRILKRAIVIIESENGRHKSSIIRAISQIIIGLSPNTQLKMAELGLNDNINSIIQIDKLKIGIVGQHDLSLETLDIVIELVDKGCGFMLCAIQKNPKDIKELRIFAQANNLVFVHLVSNWSDKLGINYLTEEQVDVIVAELRRVQGISI